MATPSRNIFNVLSDDEEVRNRAITGTGDRGDQQNRKRVRANDTPEKGMLASHYVTRIAAEMEQAKEKIGSAVLTLKVSKVVDLANSVSNILSTTLVQILEKNASLISDLAGEMTAMDGQINKLTKENDMLRDELSSVRSVKEKMEVRNSCREAEAKLEQAAKQCKLIDVNIGSCLTDRKQLQEAAKKQVRDSIRQDLKAAYDARIARAAVAVVAKAPTRKTVDGKEVWTAPVVFTTPDKDSRWELEDILRKSKMYPTYHWPKDFLDPVQELRKVVIDMGTDTNRNYIRIRPEEKDGVWKIRADVKPREGGGKFVLKAKWSVPPLDPPTRAQVTDWKKPCWIFTNPPTLNTGPKPPPDFSEDSSVTNLMG